MSLPQIVFPDQATVRRFMPTLCPNPRSCPFPTRQMCRHNGTHPPELVWWPLTKLPMVEASSAAHAWRRLAADDWVLVVTPCLCACHRLRSKYPGLSLGECRSDGLCVNGLVPVFRAQVAKTGVVQLEPGPESEREIIGHPLYNGEIVHGVTPEHRWAVRFVPDTITPVTSEETT